MIGAGIFVLVFSFTMGFVEEVWDDIVRSFRRSSRYDFAQDDHAYEQHGRPKLVWVNHGWTP